MPIKLNGATSGSVELGVPDVVGSDVQNVLLPSTAGTLDRLERAGNILQVVQTVKTDTFSLDAETFTDVTGLSVVITPISSSSKILIKYGGCIGSGANRAAHIRLVRDSTTDIFVGDQGGSSQPRASSTAVNNNTYYLSAFGGEFLDSPSTTSATTYKLQIAAGDAGQTVYVGRTDSTSNEFSRSRTPSFITVMEVAA